MKPLEGRRRRHGDRNDGFLVRNLDPMGKLIPFIMKSKADSWVLFEDRIDITHTQDFLHEMRKGKIPGLTLYHIIFAAIVRTYSQVPELNRFVARSNIYARNEMKGSMVVMKGMQRDSERTTIMPHFEMEATLKEVSDEIQALANPIDRTKKVAEDENRNDFDKLELALSLIPNWLISLVFGLLKFLDRHGWIPKKITDLSPSTPVSLSQIWALSECSRSIIISMNSALSPSSEPLEAKRRSMSWTETAYSAAGRT